MEQNLLTETETEENTIEPIEISADHFETHKLCLVCNKVQKFKVVIHKTKGKQLSGRKCVACTSKLNNEKLKERGYYKTYYIDHATELKAKDKIRYAAKKATTNLVTFD
jgi:hypothetical protein